MLSMAEIPEAWGHRAAGTKRRAQVTGQGTGHRAQGTGHRSQVTGHRSQGTGHRAQVTGHRAQVIGHRKRSKNSEDTPLGFFVLFPVTPQSGICLPSTMQSRLFSIASLKS